MTRRILLLYPRLGNAYWFGTYEPLALEIFSAIAKEEDCEVRLLDLRWERSDAPQRLIASGWIPDLVATTTHGYTEVGIVNDLLRALRPLLPEAVFIVGGIPATLRPDLLDHAVIDVICRGPGERLWRTWCQAGLERSGSCLEIKDVKPPREFVFPRPDREITAKYRRHYRTYIPNHTGKAWGPTGFTMLTQGCPFRCSFCVIWPANLGLYRRRRVDQALDELRSMKEDYIYFGDDNAFCDDGFARELAEALIATDLRKTFSSYCRADHICKHPETLRLWHRAGLRYLVIGVEAIDDATLVDVNKACDHDTNTKALAILQEIGIQPIPHLLLTPDMTAEDFDRFEDYVLANGFAYPTLVPLTPLPGTEDFNRYADRIVTDDLSYYNFMYMVVEPKHMTLRQWHARFDRLYQRIWSWRRFLRSRSRGPVSFMAFVKWWLFVRLLIPQLRWRRRQLYAMQARYPTPESRKTAFSRLLCVEQDQDRNRSLAVSAPVNGYTDRGDVLSSNPQDFS